MKLSLYQRLSFSLLLVFMLIGGGFYFWSDKIEQQTRYESIQRLNLSLAANLAHDNPLLQKGKYDHDALENLFHTLMVLGPSFEFYFLDPQGKILTYSGDASKVKRDKVDLLPILNLIQNKAELPIYGDDPRSLSRQNVFSAAPVFNGATLQGYLYVIVAGEKYEAAYQNNKSNNKFNFYVGFAATAILFLFLVMLGLFRYFTRPLCLLSKEMQALTKVGFDQSKVSLQQWPKQSHNEVFQLANGFHGLVNQVNQQFTKLSDADIHRRELLADLSHDLRTPLASLQGYMETLLIKESDKVNPLTPEQRKSYIETALKNTCQLKNLIDQIFELAHLEDGQVTLNLETFNLTELLYDIVAKFSINAEEKHIKLLIVPEVSNIQVYSDIGKMERVLTNLLENAIRHTDDGGEIILSVQELSATQCQIVVSDNGTGIKAEELSYIFDARYRASNALQDQAQHSGLGLAITKKLLELMHSDIHVKSQLGQGTTFSFNMRKAVVN
jgi:signal transduction histidine kinase